LSQRQAHGLVEPRPVDYPLRRARTSQRKAVNLRLVTTAQTISDDVVVTDGSVVSAKFVL
jgi:hypothetical protein